MCKNYNTLVFTIILALMLLPSCSQAVKPTNNTNSAVSTAEIPKHISRTINEQAVIDAEVSIPDNLKALSANVYSAQKMVFGAENTYRVFFGDKPYASRKVNSTKENGLTSTYYTAENGGTLLAGANSCHFQMPLSQYVRNVFIDNGADPNYNVPLYAAQPELKFETKSGTFTKIKEILSQLSVTVCDQYQCYAMPHDIMRAEAEKCKQALPFAAGDYKADWTADEDYYLFRLNAYAEPLPIIYEDHGNPDDGTLVLGSTIEVIYSTNGNEYLLASHIYKQTGIRKENVNLILFEDALTKAETLVNSVIITGKLTIEQIKLQYIPVKTDKTDLQYNLVPSWSFEVANTMPLENNKNNTVTTRYWIHVNAITGEEIV